MVSKNKKKQKSNSAGNGRTEVAVRVSRDKITLTPAPPPLFCLLFSQTSQRTEKCPFTTRSETDISINKSAKTNQELNAAVRRCNQKARARRMKDKDRWISRLIAARRRSDKSDSGTQTEAFQTKAAAREPSSENRSEEGQRTKHL